MDDLKNITLLIGGLTIIQLVSLGWVTSILEKKLNAILEELKKKKK